MLLVMDINKQVGSHIKSLRKSKGHSQRSFALMVNMNRSYLIGLEKGQHSITVGILEKIVKALDIKLSEFFEGLENVD